MSIKKSYRSYTTLQFIVMFGLWLLMSGHYDLLHISAGLGATTLVCLVHRRLNKYLFYEKKITQQYSLRVLSLLAYIPWLIWEIIVASLQVAYLVLHPRTPIDPYLVRFKAKLPNVTARVILGNSITLTPGTITVRIKEDEFLVHALTKSSADSITDDSLPRQVAKLFYKRPPQIASEVSFFKTNKKI